MPKTEPSYEPFVSIALTTYNGKEYLREQLDSLLTQTYKNFEIVISDDGSDEITTSILNEYAAKDKRVRWSRSPLPRGFVNNTQNAISLCKGEIIFLCDQDDVWYKNRIEKHVEAYRDPKIYWVYNRLVITDEKGNETGYMEDILPDYYQKNRIKLLYYTWGSCIGGAQTSYRSEILHKAMPIGKFAHAHDSWIQLAMFPKKSFFIPEVLQTYRQHNSNEIGVKEKKKGSAEIAELNKKSIEANLKFLKELPKNKNLQLWKRIFFLVVYGLKIFREIIWYKLLRRPRFDWGRKS